MRLWIRLIVFSSCFGGGLFLAVNETNPRLAYFWAATAGIWFFVALVYALRLAHPEFVLVDWRASMMRRVEKS